MTSNLDLKVNGKHIIGAAAVWKSPELLKIVIGNVWKIVLLLMLFSFFNSWAEKEKKYNETYAAKKQGFERLVQKCKVSQMEKHGRYDTVACKKWANAYYPVYDM